MGDRISLKFAVSSIFLLVVLSSMASASGPGEHNVFINGQPLFGCAVEEDGFLLPDLDCDGVADSDDNCRTVPNPDQADGMDSGTGDRCSIEPIIMVTPSTHIEQGNTATITLQLRNHAFEHAENVQVRIKNVHLNIDMHTVLDQIDPLSFSEVDFIVSIPCSLLGNTISRLSLTKKGQQELSHNQ